MSVFFTLILYSVVYTLHAILSVLYTLDGRYKVSHVHLFYIKCTPYTFFYIQSIYWGMYLPHGTRLILYTSLSVYHKKIKYSYPRLYKRGFCGLEFKCKKYIPSYIHHRFYILGVEVNLPYTPCIYNRYTCIVYLKVYIYY